ncbi:hypothetical protein ABGB14_30925 [Nonomuraea sp. B10E15]|uniref:hypothetical protein n=1 Tax=Nonomuraea sp. B10E15 TaxID=3153560 RepID=UPI00325DDB8E
MDRRRFVIGLAIGTLAAVTFIGAGYGVGQLTKTYPDFTVPTPIVIALISIEAAGVVVFGYLMATSRPPRLAEAVEDPGERLTRRIQAVNASFTEAAALMVELQRDLEAQRATRDALLAEAEHQQRLLELNKDQAEDIRTILVGETKQTIRAARRREWAFFLSGLLLSAALSIPIGIWVNSIS